MQLMLQYGVGVDGTVVSSLNCNVELSFPSKSRVGSLLGEAKRHRLAPRSLAPSSLASLTCPTSPSPYTSHIIVAEEQFSDRSLLEVIYMSRSLTSNTRCSRIVQIRSEGVPCLRRHATSMPLSYPEALPVVSSSCQVYSKERYMRVEEAVRKMCNINIAWYHPRFVMGVVLVGNTRKK
jgi:hypothetical protein